MLCERAFQTCITMLLHSLLWCYDRYARMLQMWGHTLLYIFIVHRYSQPPPLYVGLVIYALEYKDSRCQHQCDEHKECIWKVILQRVESLVWLYSSKEQVQAISQHEWSRLQVSRSCGYACKQFKHIVIPLYFVFMQQELTKQYS